jgi:energy-coupling factor transporter ATP-binding protein EcfA2
MFDPTIDPATLLLRRDRPMSETNGTPAAHAEPPALLEVVGLSYRYGSGPPALDDVRFTLRDGETVGLVGPSGAGKSTLLLHLAGLLPEPLPARRGLAEGDSFVGIRVLGTPVCRETVSEVRRAVGLLFQDPDDQLFCPTVAEDVAFGPLNLGLPRAEVLRRTEAALEAVDLRGCGPRPILHLSTGERKRACLAGLLACGPRLLALDEPTTNLDPRARRRLRQVLVAHGGGQLVATHDLDFVAEHCGRVLVLDGGRVRADGPAREILTDRSLMERHGLEVPWSLRTPGTAREA